MRRREEIGGRVGPLRCGVLCRCTVIEDWQARCVERLRDLPDVKIVLLVVAPLAGPPRQSGHSLWHEYDRRYVSRHSEARRPADLRAMLPDVPIQSCCSSLDEGVAVLADRAVEEIRTHDLDIILGLGVGPLGGPLLSVPPLGVWVFQHDYVSTSAGRPPGFWELVGGETVVDSSVLRLTNLNQGEVLQAGAWRARPYSYTRTLDSLCYGSAEMVSSAVNRVRTGQAGSTPSAPRIAGIDARTVPADWQTIRFIIMLAWHFVAFLLVFLFRQEQWSVGLIREPAGDLVRNRRKPEVEWLRGAGTRHFLADPFALESDGQLTVLAEEFDQRQGQGRIVALDVEGTGRFAPARAVLSSNGHMAYPYLFRWEGAVYCVPQATGTREVALFRAVHFPEVWERVGVLLSDFAASDSTVFRYQDRWWLFCSDQERGAYSTLYGWYASDLLGPWTPHPANPIKTDVRSARSAGTPFWLDGHLYRPAQNCARSYGGAITVNRIVCLTPTEFEEEPVASLEPDPHGPYPDGLHTLCAVGNITIIDGRRYLYTTDVLQARLGEILQAVKGDIHTKY